MPRAAGNLVASVVLMTAFASSSFAQPLPAHPDKLTYGPLTYNPPSSRDHRVVLKNGMVAYLVEDPALPLISVQAIVRVGTWVEPAGKAGLARLVGSQMRAGGASDLSAEQFDERADFLAAQISASVGDTQGGASLNALADNFDDSLKLWLSMLRSPRFQEDRLKLAKDQILQDMKKRNDDSADIEEREVAVLLNGEDHFTNRFSTEASINSITRDDLVAFHKQHFVPSNMILAVSGAFTRADMARKLEAAFSTWGSAPSAAQRKPSGTASPLSPPIPSATKPAAPGFYRIHKDVNQGRVSFLLPGVMRTSPDIYALEVMNEILGGSGFTSRITKTVRSNEGLAYSAGSGIGFGAFFPGRFRAAYQSKTTTVAYAAELVLGEIEKIRATPVTDEELTTIKNNLIQTFPSNFESKSQQAGVFAADEYTKRDPLFWSTYRDRIRSVTAADVQRVAKQYLVPEKLIVLVVGDLPEIEKGDGKHDVSIAKLAKGKMTDLSLRDPMTMKRK